MNRLILLIAIFIMNINLYAYQEHTEITNAIVSYCGLKNEDITNVRPILITRRNRYQVVRYSFMYLGFGNGFYTIYTSNGIRTYDCIINLRGE